MEKKYVYDIRRKITYQRVGLTRKLQTYLKECLYLNMEHKRNFVAKLINTDWKIIRTLFNCSEYYVFSFINYDFGTGNL